MLKTLLKRITATSLLFLLFFNLSTGSKIDSLQVELEPYQMDKIEKDTTYVFLLNSLAESYYSNTDSLLFYASRALKYSEVLGYTRGKAEANRFTGIYHHFTNNKEAALEHYKTAMELYTEIEDQTGIAKCYNNIAIIYDLMGKYFRSLEYYQKSLEINKELNYKKGIAYNLINIAIIYQGIGKTSEAIDNYLEALKINELRGDKNGMAICFNNIASIYGDLGKFDLKLQYNYKALKLREQINDKTGILNSSYNIAISHYNHKNPDSTQYYLDKSYILSKEIGEKLMEAKVLVAKGNLHVSEGKTEEASDNYYEALQLFTALNDPYQISNCKHKIGRLYLDQKNFSESKKYIDESYSIAKEINNLRLQQNITYTLTNFYESIGDYQKAFESLNQHHILTDSLSNNELKEQSIEFNTRYEFFQRENEMKIQQKEKEMIARAKLQRQIFITITLVIIAAILLLLLLMVNRNKEKLKLANESLVEKNIEISSQKDTLQKQADDLQKLDQMRYKIISVIAHDLRGPLSYASGILTQVVDQEKEHMKNKLHIVKQNIENIFEVMEELVNWGKMKMNSENSQPENLNIYKTINKCTLILTPQINKKKIEIENRSSRDIIAFADKEMTEVVLRNLISNAIKFSHESSSIIITTGKKESMVFVCVEDNGVGMSEEKLTAVFENERISDNGTQNEMGTGLGISLAKELVENNGGELWGKSVLGKGTSICFSLPAAKV